jgi:hypothetical protein
LEAITLLGHGSIRTHEQLECPASDIGIKINRDYVQIAERRLRRDAGMFAEAVIGA